MDLKFRFMLMNDHFSIQILSEPGFNVFLGVESEIGIMGTLHFTSAANRRNYHKGRAAIRHYANQTARPL